jgi:hypothetical protein
MALKPKDLVPVPLIIKAYRGGWIKERKRAMCWRAIARRWRDAPLVTVVRNYHNDADDAHEI